MDIVLLQRATGSLINGPVVRVPFGNYKIKKEGNYDDCKMCINDSEPMDVNGRLILSNHSSIKLTAIEARSLTIKFIRE